MLFGLVCHLSNLLAVIDFRNDLMFKSVTYSLRFRPLLFLGQVLFRLQAMCALAFFQSMLALKYLVVYELLSM